MLIVFFFYINLTKVLSQSFLISIKDHTCYSVKELTDSTCGNSALAKAEERTNIIIFKYIIINRS